MRAFVLKLRVTVFVFVEINSTFYIFIQHYKLNRKGMTLESNERTHKPRNSGSVKIFLTRLAGFGQLVSVTLIQIFKNSKIWSMNRKDQKIDTSHKILPVVNTNWYNKLSSELFFFFFFFCDSSWCIYLHYIPNHIIMKTRLFKYIDWNFHLQKAENFQIKHSDIFQISAQNIDCGYS